MVEPTSRLSTLPAAIDSLGTRHLVTFLLFLGMANAYIMRTNMSVAIVAMVNHTALAGKRSSMRNLDPADGPYVWTSTLQGYILSSFFYGYVLTQIPFGILAKKYGARLFLGIGMLINSVFGMLVPIAASAGFKWLILVRFIQGLGEGPIVPCTHAMLAKWIPPNERSRLGAAVYSGAQFGTIIAMPVSGLLSSVNYLGGWPLIFYIFGLVSAIWCFFFLYYVAEDPQSDPRINSAEREHIVRSLWGPAGFTSNLQFSITLIVCRVHIHYPYLSPPIPWQRILHSMPFWAIMCAHMGQNYGYETLMTELPTFMRQILNFSIKDNGFVSALPYLAMWLFSMGSSVAADWTLSRGILTHTQVRKLLNSIGQYGPAIGMYVAANTGDSAAMTVAALTVGVGLNGGIYSGFKVNHLDISPRFAGILMAFTNCVANFSGLLAPIVAGHIIEGRPTQVQWMKVFYIASLVYVFSGTFFNAFSTGLRQSWDNPETDDDASLTSVEQNVPNLTTDY